MKASLGFKGKYYVLKRYQDRRTVVLNTVYFVLSFCGSLTGCKIHHMKPTVFRTASNAVDRTDHRFPRFLTLTACIRHHIPTDIPPVGCGCRTCESVLYYSSSQLLTKNLISQIYSSTSPKPDAPRFTYSNDPRFTYSNDPKLLLAYAKSLGHSLP